MNDTQKIRSRYSGGWLRWSVRPEAGLLEWARSEDFQRNGVPESFSRLLVNLHPHLGGVSPTGEGAHVECERVTSAPQTGTDAYSISTCIDHTTPSGRGRVFKRGRLPFAAPLPPPRHHTAHRPHMAEMIEVLMPDWHCVRAITKQFPSLKISQSINRKTGCHAKNSIKYLNPFPTGRYRRLSERRQNKND